MDAAGGELRGLWGIETAAVAGALEEADVRDERVARERVEIEQQRPVDEAVDQEAMAVRRDVGHAAVMALVVQGARRDDALEMLERRARGTGARRARHGADRAHNVGLVLRAGAVGAHAAPGRLHPLGQIRRHGGRGRPHSHEREPGGAGQEQAPMQQAVAGDGLEIGPLVTRHGFLPRPARSLS